MTRKVLFGLALAAGALAPRLANARVIQESRYSYDLTWNAAIRMLHVDMGFAITERDRDAGYVLFTYRDANRTSPGSLELVHVQVEGLAGTRIIVQLPTEPTYAEHLIVSHLQRKLHDEYGDPPTPPRPAPTPPPAVASARDGEQRDAPAHDDRAPTPPTRNTAATSGTTAEPESGAADRSRRD